VGEGKGTIMAEASVTVTTGATLDGRALARTGAVTLDDNTVVVPPRP
jgi:Ice-binding-like